jgi:glycosyltransferase involved in cell wall biosynthesis
LLRSGSVDPNQSSTFRTQRIVMSASEQADVTVAVATVDRPDALGRCLDAILRGDVRPRELIVVDQGHDDQAPAIVRERDTGETLMRYIRQDARGLAASRNAGLLAAQCPVVAVTDDDCVPSSSWIAAVARGFSAANAPQAVTGPVLPLPGKGQGYAVSSRTSLERVDYQGRHAPWLVGTGANLAVRRDLAADIGGYDERLGVGTAGGAGEDLDFLHRLLRAGALIRYEPDAHVYHELQSKQRRRATRSSYGRGVGACCGLWLRNGDLSAVPMLGRWFVLRGRLLARATLRRDWEGMLEEVQVFGGTARGLAYGVRLGGVSGTPRLDRAKNGTDLE